MTEAAAAVIVCEGDSIHLVKIHEKKRDRGESGREGKESYTPYSKATSRYIVVAVVVAIQFYYN